MSIIINGDDYGMNRRCSEAIARAFGEGLITDTTMMANGGYFEEAVALAAAEGFSDKIGIHFNLTEGEPLSGDIRGLSAFVSVGGFHKGFLKIPRPLSEDERAAVYAELSAQAARISGAGIGITHADSHHYIHNNIYLAPIVSRVCKEYGICKIRLSRTFDTPDRPRVTQNVIDNSFWRQAGFKTAAHFGRLSDVMGGDIPDGAEIMVHPDFDRNGGLIDRTGVEDGFTAGDSLPRLSSEFGVTLTSYTLL